VTVKGRRRITSTGRMTTEPLRRYEKVNVNEIKEEPWQSPGGKYAAHFKESRSSLGRDRTRSI